VILGFMEKLSKVQLYGQLGKSCAQRVVDPLTFGALRSAPPRGDRDSPRPSRRRVGRLAARPRWWSRGRQPSTSGWPTTATPPSSSAIAIGAAARSASADGALRRNHRVRRPSTPGPGISDIKPNCSLPRSTTGLNAGAIGAAKLGLTFSPGPRNHYATRGKEGQ
jgi:hypothetical protein